MAKPETYKGNDAVKLTCLRTYEVKDGSDDPVTYDAGKDYTVGPRSAAHLLRQQYNAFDKPKGDQVRGKYLGSASYFIEAEQAKANKAAKAKPAAKAAETE